eukprot:24580_4
MLSGAVLSPNTLTRNSRTLFCVPSKVMMLEKRPAAASTSCVTVAFPRRSEGLNVASAAVVKSFCHRPSNAHFCSPSIPPYPFHPRS